MKKLQLFLLFAFIAVVTSFSCPPKNQVAKTIKECRSDKDCGAGKCCDDQKNTKSCAIAASQDNYGGKSKKDLK